MNKCIKWRHILTYSSITITDLTPENDDENEVENEDDNEDGGEEKTDRSADETP